MSYTYKGTKITGTSTASKIFKKSGLHHAKKNQTYFNKDSGHVYKCTKEGKASVAQWQYVRTDIAHKPKLTVTKMGAPVRTTKNGADHIMKADWTVPKDLVNDKKGNRATGLHINWYLGIAGTDPKKATTTKNENTTTSEINLNGVKIGKKTYTRASFYPLSKQYLSYVTCEVVPYNKKGTGKNKTTATRKFAPPRKPVIADFTFNTETGAVSTTVTTDAGADYQERYDTCYIMTVENSRTGKTWQQSNNHSTSTSIPLSYNVSDYQQLSYDEYVKVTVEAWARGYAGPSEHVKKTYYVSYPSQVTIENVAVSSKDSTGKCTAYINTNKATAHPIDRVKLEYLANCNYSQEQQIPGGASWTASDVIDDGNCTALAIGVTNLIPNPGKYTWIRVKSWHANETVLHRYSAAMRVRDLETPEPTAEDDYIAILDTKPGADGKSLEVLLGWNTDGQDDSTGTELTWSEDGDAWRSTDDPEKYDFEWSDGAVTAGGQTYHDSATVFIKGLDESTKYYIRARRYLEGEDRTTYSPYSNIATEITSERPEAVVASCDRYVPVGGSLPVYWTFSGNGLQTEWQIVSSSGAVIDSAENSLGSTQIDAERLATFATNNSVTFTVQVSTGSGFVVSEEHTVRLIEPPTLSIGVTSPLTVQPLSFTATSNRQCDLTVYVYAQGAAGQFPTGLKRQTAGDTIYSEYLTPQWTASGQNYTATIMLPAGLDLWDLGRYTITAVATDRDTELTSDASSVQFAVAWAHQAPDPFDAVTITAVDTTDDESGRHTQAVEIALTPPENSVATDVYDIYRVTGDGAYLIGESFPLTYTATDEYAPFGDGLTLWYRVACRTADGDVEFADIEYVADGQAMRFDWAGGSLELPYNLSIGDKYDKDVDVRQHMDGSTDAYWNDNVTRTGSLSSDLIRLDSQDEVNLARQLARYTGAVFVRTPDGAAYEADVQVSNMSTNGPLEAITIDATEIGLTQEFILPTPFALDEEE